MAQKTRENTSRPRILDNVPAGGAIIWIFSPNVTQYRRRCNVTLQ